MTTNELYFEAEQLERKLRGANLETRLVLQPSVTKVIERMHAKGMNIPSRFKRLDAALLEDAVEAQFDNVPI